MSGISKPCAFRSKVVGSGSVIGRSVGLGEFPRVLLLGDGAGVRRRPERAVSALDATSSLPNPWKSDTSLPAALILDGGGGGVGLGGGGLSTPC